MSIFEEAPRTRDVTFSRYEKYANRNLSRHLKHPVRLKSNEHWIKKVLLLKIEMCFKDRQDAVLLLRAVV